MVGEIRRYGPLCSFSSVLALSSKPVMFPQSYLLRSLTTRSGWCLYGVLSPTQHSAYKLHFSYSKVEYTTWHNGCVCGLVHSVNWGHGRKGEQHGVHLDM